MSRWGPPMAPILSSFEGMGVIWLTITCIILIRGWMATTLVVVLIACLSEIKRWGQMIFTKSDVCCDLVVCFFFGVTGSTSMSIIRLLIVFLTGEMPSNLERLPPSPALTWRHFSSNLLRTEFISNSEECSTTVKGDRWNLLVYFKKKKTSKLVRKVVCLTY